MALTKTCECHRSNVIEKSLQRSFPHEALTNRFKWVRMMHQLCVKRFQGRNKINSASARESQSGSQEQSKKLLYFWQQHFPSKGLWGFYCCHCIEAWNSISFQIQHRKYLVGHTNHLTISIVRRDVGGCVCVCVAQAAAHDCVYQRKHEIIQSVHCFQILYLLCVNDIGETFCWHYK